MSDHHPWRDRLSEYLDDDLSSTERQQLEAHLSVCAECSTAVDDLRHIVASAHTLESVSEPARDLWPGIEERLVRVGAVRAVSVRSPRGARQSQQRQPAKGSGISRAELLAGWFPFGLPVAAMLTIACVGVVAWLTLRESATPAPTTSARATASVAAVEADRQYDDTLSGLRRLVEARLMRDPRVLEVIETNLATIDVAIAEYRDVLTRQPEDEDLSRRLMAAKERKLVLLRQAATLAAEGTD